ncbi:hypothetical protein PBT90_20375 [Algoriphagus halophytocola]|uniref:hypothetical protein n=1 Tax=Algoriphagus halophytocola TaxID=2991499 RepID=UPI0022DE4F76|nr:hypothetical protein [Algoriphagus sp. TR-M9]WBL42403.1 hypothetical protein PBT90_16830 [Algoriphagus sp. TR-M9]WBL43086.1 hypothetical protein PBT90_20375 [Algoriphagus sp. TR-M9]
MDRWQELINYLNMIAEWIQVIFTGVGLILAFGYLRQHAKKVRLERSYSLVHGCMVKISKYVGQYHLFYKQSAAPRYKVMLKETSPVEAIDEIYDKYYELKRDLVDIDLLNFEIDAEIKLISNSRITALWVDLLDKHEAIGSIYENIYSAKGDQEKCDDLIWDLPDGLLNKNHSLSIEFLTSYRRLMDSLLIFYREQENELESIPVLNLFRLFKKPALARFLC